MFEALDNLGGALRVDATRHDFVRVFLNQGITFRAFGGQRNLPLFASPLLCQYLDNIGDDIPGALDDDMITDTDIETLDLVPVVQAGPGDSDPADNHRFEMGNRGDGAGAADLKTDIFDDCLLLAWWET